MFLGSQDIQLGVNETLYDSAKVISSMADGIMARVGHHSEVEVRPFTFDQGRKQHLTEMMRFTDSGRTRKRPCHQCSITSVSSYSNFGRPSHPPRNVFFGI